MLDDFLNNFHISKQQLKVFIGTFLAMFIMVALQSMGIRSPWKTPKLVLPFPKTSSTIEKIRPKLEKKTNTFALITRSSLVPISYAASDADTAKAYAVVDLDTGEVLAEKNGTQQLPIASLTKIMTAVVSLDLAQPSELFSVTKLAASMPATKLGIIPGEKMSLEELLNGALLTSANDAAEEIKDGINQKYQDDIFVNAMNEKASFLGLEHTHFTNSQGMDAKDNYSSAEDLAVLTKYALTNYPLITSIVKKDYQFLPANQNHKQFDLYNWNGLLDVYPNIEGMKIGNTDDAGYTTAVLSTRGGKKLLVVILGAPGVLERDLLAAELLDIGYQKTLGLAPINVTDAQLKEKYATWRYWN